MILAALLLATATTVNNNIANVADDAKAVDRIAAASKHDLPAELLRRMLNDDIETLRGKRKDGGYDYASFERFEASRTGDSFSVEANDDPEKLTKLEVKGSWLYRLVIEVPSRRLVVTKNRRVFIDRAEIEYIPEKGGPTKRQVATIQAWVDPGAFRNVDFDEVARQATVRVYARSEKESGYGNVNLSLLQAKVSDNPDSPYADAVSSAKAILRALDHEDIASIRAMAQRMYTDLAGKSVGAPPAVATIAVEAAAAPLDVTELQAIEDLLTGSETERRQGMDRLHQLIRKLRPTAAKP